MGIAFLVYGSFHLYAFAKVWMAYPHSLALGLALAFGALVLTFLPSVVWRLERRNLQAVTVATAWVSTHGWGICSCSFALACCSISAMVFPYC